MRAARLDAAKGTEPPLRSCAASQAPSAAGRNGLRATRLCMQWTCAMPWVQPLAWQLQRSTLPTCSQHAHHGANATCESLQQKWCAARKQLVRSWPLACRCTPCPGQQRTWVRFQQKWPHHVALRCARRCCAPVRLACTAGDTLKRMPPWPRVLGWPCATAHTSSQVCPVSGLMGSSDLVGFRNMSKKSRFGAHLETKQPTGRLLR